MMSRVALRCGAVARGVTGSPAVARSSLTSVGTRTFASVADFMGSDPNTVASTMVKAGCRRGYALLDAASGRVVASHDHLQPLADFMDGDKTDMLGVRQHEGIFLEVGEESGLLMGAFLWWTDRGQGCGGIRLQPYAAMENFIRDGMRLSLGMGRKSALADLWWGGGKGVVVRNDERVDIADTAAREAIFRDYGRFLTSLRGCYVAAEDAGVNVTDVDVVFRHTRYTTCISPGLGGSGNPSVPTAAGVVEAMEGALAHKQRGTLEGKSVALQGVGNVGLPLIKFMIEKGVASIEAVDTPQRVAQVREEVAAAAAAAKHDVSVQLFTTEERSDILEARADIVSPCALGGGLNADSIPKIWSETIVCGAANNQLKEPADAQRIQDAGFTYVPDFVANRMGIVNCANEQYGRIGSQGELKDPAITQHFDRSWDNSVYRVTQAVLAAAEREGLSTADAANELADAAARKPHPIWGASRSRDIMASLVADDWAAGGAC